jgi:peptidoglycan DL-endopeptidase CwlO
VASDSARRHARQICIAISFAVTTTLTMPVLPAHADPDVTAARKKLVQLNEQVDKLVEKFNQAEEDLKVAKAKLRSVKKAATREQDTYEEVRQNIAQMAADAYKNGEMGEVANFVGDENPQAVLDRTAVLTHLTRNRSSEVNLFLAAAQRLQRQQAQAQQAFNDVNERAKKLRDQRRTVERAIAKQKKVLEQAGVTTTTGGGSGGGGGDYNGPASGPARKALEFAYAQIGKPYQYGAEGPGSYDCSGLTMRAWGAAGVSITRTTNSQYAATKRVSKANLQPGDLVFFSGLGHVGIYVGNGKMVHAPRTGKNVEEVSITSGYYLSNYYGAGRP